MKRGRVSTCVHLVPGGPAVNRAILRIAYLGARVVWFCLRPAHQGAVVALWEGCRVLLVHQTYRRRWTLPGGGVGRGEAPETAARREVAEELGIDPGPLRAALAVAERFEWRNETVHIFEAALDGATPRPDGIEIDKTALLTVDEALNRDVPTHIRTYLLSRGAEHTVASSA